jgi:hypothetical protein
MPDRQEILEDLLTGSSQDRFGVELDTINWKSTVT